MEEKDLELYNKAKEAYYNGEEIMTDQEFDELEERLGLENKSHVGSKSPSYTVRHPFMMGSLSKVQVKADSDGNVDWANIVERVMKYVGNGKLIITPKYDGCSFEYYWDGKEVSISSRGDGNYGKDLSKHICRQCTMLDIRKGLPNGNEPYTIRGEVLINKNVFAEKYSEYVNPRAFVSGILNRKYEDIEDLSVLDDLSIVVYDFRRLIGGEWHDYDWTELTNTYAGHNLPEMYNMNVELESPDDFRRWYNDYSNYRDNISLFALDGFVIKPVDKDRKLNLDRERPEDCVAIKFLPQIKETVVTGLQWKLGKTGEFTPVVLFEPIILDGKEVTKASGSNYGYVNGHGIDCGAKIRVSLAGDIIPFIYKVVEPVELDYEFDDDMYVNGCHLMKTVSVSDKMELDFLASCKSLGIPGIGDKVAQQIYDYLDYKRDHVFFVSCEEIFEALYFGEGKTANAVLKAFNKAKEDKSLADVIASMNISGCGPKCAGLCARFLITGDADFSGINSEGYDWLKVDSDRIYSRLLSILRHKDNSSDGHEFDKYKNDYTSNEEQIKVILTGSPTQYATKKDFLKNHPEYVETGKFSECKILFTGDINSTSSKMLKARKLGIEIRQY